jgi:hypothetical protein
MNNALALAPSSLALSTLPTLVSPKDPLVARPMFVYLSVGTVVELASVTSVELTADAISFYNRAEVVGSFLRADVWSSSRMQTCSSPD